MTNPDRAPIKSDDIDTARGDDSSRQEAALTTATLSPVRRFISSRQGHDSPARPHYVAPMGTHATVHDIAAGLREQHAERITYLPDRKLHALLYFAQLLWLAVEDEPLFPDQILATEVGVQVAADPDLSTGPLGDPHFGHTVFTVGRYGGLPAMDLEALIRGQGPWAVARATGDKVVTAASLSQWIRIQEENPEGTLLGRRRPVRGRMLRPESERKPNPGIADTREEIDAFIAEVRSRM